MTVKVFGTAIVIVALCSQVQRADAQTFSPSDQNSLMHPGAVGTYDSTTQSTKTAKPAAKNPSKNAQPSNAGVSLSSELGRGNAATGNSAPTIAPRATAQQKQPWDQRVPFGPLSLGLQAEGSPRSDSLTTPSPAGLGQFKKDRFEPYVGVSIIDLKR